MQQVWWHHIPSVRTLAPRCYMYKEQFFTYNHKTWHIKFLHINCHSFIHSFVHSFIQLASFGVYTNYSFIHANVFIYYLFTTQTFHYWFIYLIYHVFIFYFYLFIPSEQQLVWTPFIHLLIVLITHSLICTYLFSLSDHCLVSTTHDSHEKHVPADYKARLICSTNCHILYENEKN